MKTTKQTFIKMMALILPFFLLCSCYEIVYITQDADNLPNGILHPTICVQVNNVDDKPIIPYIGMLLPTSWEVIAEFPFTKQFNNGSVEIGEIKFDNTLSKIMEDADPAPNGYYWWVGAGQTTHGFYGVYKAYPSIQTSDHAGKYFIDYMVGDSENGINIQRSDDHMIVLVDENTPTSLKATAMDNSIQLKWKAPSSNMKVSSYVIYRNGEKINTTSVGEIQYIDQDIKPGSYSYIVQPVFSNGSYGKKCIERKICFASCGTSIDFDGENGKVMVFDDPSLNLAGAFTLEAWINYRHGQSAEPRIISKGEKGTGYELLLTNLSKGKSLEFRTPMGEIKSSSPLLPDKWYHVAVVYDGKLLKVFINGKPDSKSFTEGQMSNIPYPLMIGRSCSIAENYFNGLIDEVRVWDIGRSEKEILENFSVKVDPLSEGLKGNWSMSEGCSMFVCDASTLGNHGYLSGSCWSPTSFPYVEDVKNQTNNKLEVPVIHYTEGQSPQSISMEFKINPKLLEFEGVIRENTQLELYDVKYEYLDDGTIIIQADKINNSIFQNEVMVIIDLKPLLPHVKTNLIFSQCLADDLYMRVGSGEIIATALPDTYKTDIGPEQDMNAVIQSVYPNPASSFLNIQLGELNSGAEIRIMNIMGQEVYHSNVQPNESNSIHKINLLGFSQGVYLVNLRLTNKTQIVKFTVN